ncbi:hypothetical protein PYW08_015211 [Mythimna loreyi]|uniref:Uncharacterized protein n=1 Tax=Mythimna loreyi TaxID=667449 RepID=A0ACC2QVJ5_9NEOP|nr:hypothetical protein PYW08_015211 [Mythimna loreyi]
MKLLLVFVSALGLVQGNVTSSEENDSVYEVKTEAEAVFAAVAGQEAGGESPQALDAQEIPKVRVFGAEGADDSVYEIKPEAEAAYAAVGQEAGGEAPQALDAQETPEASVFGAEEQPQGYEVAEPLAEELPVLGAGVYLPSVARVCTASWCSSTCWRLGYRYAQCISLDTCWCHN